MTIAEFMTTILRHKINLNKEILVLRDTDNAAENFNIDEWPSALFLIPHGDDVNTHHSFLDEEGEKKYV